MNIRLNNDVSELSRSHKTLLFCIYNLSIILKKLYVAKCCVSKVKTKTYFSSWQLFHYFSFFILSQESRKKTLHTHPTVASQCSKWCKMKLEILRFRRIRPVFLLQYGPGTENQEPDDVSSNCGNKHATIKRHDGQHHQVRKPGTHAV